MGSNASAHVKNKQMIALLDLVETLKTKQTSLGVVIRGLRNHNELDRRDIESLTQSLQLIRGGIRLDAQDVLKYCP